MSVPELCLAQIRFSPLPTWLTVPIAGIALVLVLWHMYAVSASDMPASRKRIRLASGAVFMLLIPCSVAAFSLVTPAYERSFILVWIIETGLLFIVIMLAAGDLYNTHRLRQEHRENLRQEILAARAVLLEALDQRVKRVRDAAQSEGGPGASAGSDKGSLPQGGPAQSEKEPNENSRGSNP